MRIQFPLCVILIVCASAVAQNQVDDAAAWTGLIRGSVLNDQALPVAGAEVSIDIIGNTLLGRSPRALTNSKGEFELSGVPSGEVLVIATKPADLYPDARAAVFSDGPESLPKVFVERGKAVTGVVIRLRRGGQLKGSIVDVETGKPILAARIRLIRLDKPDAFFSSSPTIKGDFRFAIPAARQFQIQITAPGYEAWRTASPIVVAAGGTQDLEIRLARISK